MKTAELLEIIRQCLAELVAAKWTGEVVFSIRLNQGGIVRAKITKDYPLTTK